MDFLQHIIDKATSDCGVGFGVLCVVMFGMAIAMKIIVSNATTREKSLLDAVAKMQENLIHAGESMERILVALASSREKAAGD